MQERAEELRGPFHYEFSYWARYGGPLKRGPRYKLAVLICVRVDLDSDTCRRWRGSSKGASICEG